MSNFFISRIRFGTWLGLFFLICFVGLTRAAAADPKLEVQLVWGTNGESSPDKNHKALDPALAKKLGMFKWKKYFTVNREEISLTPHGAQKIRLSPQCEVEIKQIEGPRYEINVFGKGKHVRKIIEKITKEDSLVIAGDDKNDCAWIILIREIK